MKIKRFLSLILAMVFCLSACLFVTSCDKEEEEEQNKGQTVANPFYITYREVKIELDKKAEDVLDKLGKSKERKVQAALSCRSFHDLSVAAPLEFHKVGCLDDGPSKIYCLFCGFNITLSLKALPIFAVCYIGKAHRAKIVA